MSIWLLHSHEKLSLINANNILFSWQNRFSKWTAQQDELNWDRQTMNAKRSSFHRIQCVKFIVQDIPFMLVATLFPTFILRVCAFRSFFLTSIRWLLSRVTVYTFTSFIFRRFANVSHGMWPFALFPAVLHSIHNFGWKMYAANGKIKWNHCERNNNSIQVEIEHFNMSLLQSMAR